MKSTDCARKFSVLDTQVAKGVAITLMVMHHLFAFPERIAKSQYASLLPWEWQGQPIEYHLGKWSHICIALFIFLSGYGMCQSLMKSAKVSPVTYSFKKFLDFYKMFLPCFALFISIGYLFFSQRPEYASLWPNLAMNFLSLSVSYNQEWWFLRVYFLLLCYFPFAYFLARRQPLLLFLISMAGCSLSRSTNIVWGILYWQGVFTIGILVAATDFFEKTPSLFKDTPSKRTCLLIFLSVWTTAIFLIGRGDMFAAPILVYYLSRFWTQGTGQQILSFLGKHSLGIWLVHSFFIYHFFQPLVLLPRSSILILVWALVLSVFVPYGVAYLQKFMDIPFTKNKNIAPKPHLG